MRYALRRAAWAVFVVWAVTSLAFVVDHALPADPARMVAGPQARPADVARLRAQLGLDLPLRTQYARFMRRAVHVAPPRDPPAAHDGCTKVAFVHVDLGRSYQQRRPVIAILADRLPRTLFLAAAALLVQIAIGAAAGIGAAARRGTAIDRGVAAAALAAISVPAFVSGLALQYLFAHRLRILPLDGYGQTAMDHARSVVLPAIALGLFGAATYTRLVREEMLGALGEDYMRTARAKGAPPWRVLVAHGARNALAPLTAAVALDLGALTSGAVVIETVFRWPGVGALGVNALLDRDGPVLLGTVIVTSAAVVLANLAADLAYAAIDPRVRAE